MRRKLIFVLLIGLLAGLMLWTGKEMSGDKAVPVVKGYEAWSPETLSALSALPVRNGDRIKPFSTYAKVLMLEYHGDHRISFQDEDGEKFKVGPQAFLLDALLRPSFSKETPIFQVENSEILASLGKEVSAGAGYYCYNEIAPYRKKLFELATGYEEQKKNEEELDVSQTQTLALARIIRNYEVLLSYFNFARAGVVLPVQPGSAKGMKPQMVSSSAFMSMAGEIQKVIAETKSKGKDMPRHLVPVLEQVLNHANDAKYGPILLNPEDTERGWQTVGGGIMGVFKGIDPNPASTISGVHQLEELYKTYRNERGKFTGKMKEVALHFQNQLSTQEQKDLKSEVTYNKAKWFFYARFFCFVPAILLITLSWLAPVSRFGRVMGWGTGLFSFLGLALTITGITHRAMIMHRPPVGNLYDTIIFIAAGCVFIALVTELISRRKLALGIAPYIGFFLLTLAHLYEQEEGVDNLEPLIAVLRSNYWLTVHVLTITLGYAAGLVAWLFGCIYVFVRLLGLDKEDPSLRKLIARMTYGSICFTLLLSLIGTVLGGIWANDSWGRFWGWDPKENGALMIVLWALFVLHARLGGILKEWGLHLAAIVTGPIVVFSWWHVNLLGVGLHSYGFSDSKAGAVNLFYLVNIILLIVAFITAMAQGAKKQS